MYAMEVQSMTLASHVAAELLKFNRLLELRSRTLNTNGRRLIGPTQGRILAFLLRHYPNHVTLSTIAKDTALSPATASEVVKRLGERGLVRKVRSRDDARVIHLSLSAAGRRKAEKVEARSSHLHATIGTLTYREQELFLHALKNVQQGMNRQEDKP
jgi:DNA-binding MarR family transcriptional regulator